MLGPSARGPRGADRARVPPGADAPATGASAGGQAARGRGGAGRGGAEGGQRAVHRQLQ